MNILLNCLSIYPTFIQYKSYETFNPTFLHTFAFNQNPWTGIKKKRKCNFSAEERREKWKQQLWNKIFWCILSDRVGYRAVFTLQSKIHLHYGIETRDRICYSNGATLLKMAEPSANGGSFVPSLLPDKTLPIFFLTLFHSSLKKNSSHTHLIISKKNQTSLYPFIQYFLQYQSRSFPK